MGAIFKSVKRVSELMKCEVCFKGVSQSPPILTTPNPFPYTAKFMLVVVRHNKTQQIRR